MTRLAIVPLLAGLFAPAAVGQLPNPTPITARSDQDRQRVAELAQAKQTIAVERTEDIEVLRRILNKVLGLPNQAVPQAMANACNSCHNTAESHLWGHATAVAGDINHYKKFVLGTAPTTSPHAVGPFDGVYLPGHGVVFTLKVPDGVGVVLDAPAKAFGLLETCLKCHASVAKDAVEPSPSAAKPATEWDRTLAELRGQKSPEGQKAGSTVVSSATVCDPGKMSESILTKLYDNARHIRHLSPTERVTVVITFDGHAGSARDRITLSGAGSVVDASSNTALVSGDWYGSRPLTLVQDGIPVRHGFTSEEGQQLNLGDLHLRQGKPKEAAAAYEKALARFKDAAVKINPNLPAKQRTDMATEFQKGIRDAYRHLAQAYLASNEPEKAQAALDRARNFKVELTTGTGTTPIPGIPVPAKLVLGLTKGDLDKTATDPAAFKKAVTVETVGFPPADKPSKPKQ